MALLNAWQRQIYPKVIVTPDDGDIKVRAKLEVAKKFMASRWDGKEGFNRGL